MFFDSLKFFEQPMTYFTYKYKDNKTDFEKINLKNPLTQIMPE